ncbi:VC0807 family protein [Sporosarcina sp. FSL K6-1508]|uniref:VC0807 family protein n=1 Tax=Sporosarcina sp. FSL K6-1508 TaxID=2921553 RepID=UPI0030F5F95F
MNKKLVIYDIIFYAVIPFFIWTYGKEPLGDYTAILLSTVPGFIYTIYRFIKEKELNIAGLFIITSLFISTAVNLLSTSADSMLWNQVYLGFGTCIIYLISMIIRKPMALYFMVDIAYLYGDPREFSKRLFNSDGLFMWFQIFNLLFIVRGIFLSTLKAFLVKTYGAAGYGKMLIYMNISSLVFSGLILLGYFFINKKVKQYLKEQEEVKEPAMEGEI